MMTKIFVNIKMKTLMEKQITPGDSSEEKLFNYDENTMISRKLYLQQACAQNLNYLVVLP